MASVCHIGEGKAVSGHPYKSTSSSDLNPSDSYCPVLRSLVTSLSSLQKGKPGVTGISCSVAGVPQKGVAVAFHVSWDQPEEVIPSGSRQDSILWELGEDWQRLGVIPQGWRRGTLLPLMLGLGGRDVAVSPFWPILAWEY